jgi:4-amino-4-deoxy-L-arabinose transferase-like glycosyltransferase
VTARLRDAPRRELAVLAGALAVGLAIRVAYVLATRGHALAGDEIEYDIEGRLAAAGHWFWSTRPYGIPHASLTKAPLYPAWVGGLYELLGARPDRVLLVQTLLGPVTIALTWALGRRVFSPGTGLAAAWVVAVYPLAWQFEARLYSESLATPLTLALLIVVLGRAPTPPRAALAGALLGLNLLVRPSAVFLLALVAAGWLVGAGLRRGLGMTAVSAAVTVLVVAPWAYRNHHVDPHGFVPISYQSEIAAYGTFNDVAAHDGVHPYAWRPPSPNDPLFDPGRPMSDAALTVRLRRAARSYVADHPNALYKAFFWNGLSRLWDVRRPQRALDEVPFEGRSATLTGIGLGMYYVLLALALAALWRERRRRPWLVIPVLAMVAAASLTFTADAGTRYRATLEPLIAVLACGAVTGWLTAPRRGERSPRPPGGRSFAPSSPS